MAQLRRYESELLAHDVDVKIVTFDNSELASTYRQRSGLNWPVLIDAHQHLYHAYGMRRASWWTLGNPIAVFRYLKLILEGTRPGPTGRDWHQLGGDVIIDPSGMIRMHHISTHPHDRPPVSEILQRVLPDATRPEPR